MTDIAANFDRIRAQMKRAERIAGREEGETNLIAVTKTQNQETLAAAAAIGHRLFGENKVQEAQAHWSALRARYSDIVLHMIGPLQTNKAAEAVGLFDVIETLDREKLADELSKQQKKQHRSLEYYIQVNTGEEEQKAGIEPARLAEFIAYCRHDCGLNVTGLMCIPPVDEPAALHFALLKKLADTNQLKNRSMGMSTDFEKAIMLGATHVRIGTALFGARTV